MLPVEVGLEQGELTGDLDGVQGHEVEGLRVSWLTDVPLDGRRRVLEGDAVTGNTRLNLQLPLDDLSDGLHPLSHRLT